MCLLITIENTIGLLPLLLEKTVLCTPVVPNVSKIKHAISP